MANLTDADIRRPLQRAELTSLDNGDGIVVEDISDSKVKYIKRENLNPLASKVEITDAGDRYTATDAENALQEIAGDGRTTETVKGNADDIATLDGRMDTAESDIDAIEGVLVELDESLGEPNGIATLDATGKIPSSQLPVSAMEYKGAWDASTGSYPTSPDTGDYWSISVAGTISSEEYDVGDAIVYNGASWDKLNKVEIAQEVSYDNSESGLSAVNVQDAIDENADAISAVKGTGWTDENLVDHETRIDTLENNDTILKESLLTTKLAVNELERQSQIGNGATLDFEDIGTVALDARATGRANPTVDGLTATNLSVEGQTFQTNRYTNKKGEYHLEDGHKYFVSLTREVISGTDDSPVTGRVTFFPGDYRILNTLNGSWTRTAIVTFSGVTGNYSITFYGTDDCLINWIDFTFINLTSIYGSGNEPSASDCAKIFSYFDGTKSIQMPARVVSKGKNLFDKSGSRVDQSGTSSYENETGVTVENAVASTFKYTQYFLNLKPNTQYTLYADAEIVGSGQIYFGLINPLTGNFYTGGTKTSSGSATITTNSLGTVQLRFASTYTTNQEGMVKYTNIMLNLGSTATSYEPYQDSTLYIADDEEARSVPAVKDQVKVVNGELVKVQNVSEPYIIVDADLDSSMLTLATNFDILGIILTNFTGIDTTGWDNTYNGTVSIEGFVEKAYSDVLANVGSYYLNNTPQIRVCFAKGTTIATAKASLLGKAVYYSLATPIYTPLTTSGTLKAFQNGTVYWEPYYEGSHQTDASSEITLPYEGTIDAVYGYDDNLDEYLLDSSEYSLVGTTLTITGALENEVFYVQMSRSEPLAPEMSVNVLNDDRVLLNPTNGKFYDYTIGVSGEDGSLVPEFIFTEVE